MSKPFSTFPNTAQQFKNRQGKPQVEGVDQSEGRALNQEFLETLTIAELQPIIRGLEIEGSGAKGKVLKADMVEELLR